MKRFGLILLLASGLAPSVTFPQTYREDSAAVARVVLQFHTALTAGDTSAAMALLADDVRVLESGGVETRDEYRAHHLAADIQFAQAVPGTTSPPMIRIRNGVAWSISTSITQGTFKGRDVNSAGAELMVLTHEKDGWRIRSIHWSSRRRTEP